VRHRRLALLRLGCGWGRARVFCAQGNDAPRVGLCAADTRQVPGFFLGRGKLAVPNVAGSFF
jgi:hypothetical protein